MQKTNENPNISDTIWLFNIAMENPPFLVGKPSISMGHFPWLC
jgi:hypothetical protein